MAQPDPDGETGAVDRGTATATTTKLAARWLEAAIVGAATAARCVVAIAKWLTGWIRSIAKVLDAFNRYSSRFGDWASGKVELAVAWSGRAWRAGAAALSPAARTLGRPVVRTVTRACGALRRVAVPVRAATTRVVRRVGAVATGTVARFLVWLRPRARRMGETVSRFVRVIGQLTTEHRRVVVALAALASIGCFIAVPESRSVGGAAITVLRTLFAAALLFLVLAAAAVLLVAGSAAVLAALASLLRRCTGSVDRWIRRRTRPVVRLGRVAWVRARARLTTISQPEPIADAQTGRRAGAVDAEFHAEVFHNMYLAKGSHEVHAIISVAGRSSEASRTTEAATVFLLDCSGSMGEPWSKLREVGRATESAIDAMPDGSWFAIVRCNHRAEPVYPAGGGLARAGADTREAAKLVLGLLWPEGGTAMGRWLLAARDILATRPAAIGHAVLLTDGRNESEPAAALDAALTACRASFRCECRGVGTDWEVDELRRIASSMLGTVDIVADPVDLAADFLTITEAAMARTVPDVSLRVWTPIGARVHYLRQVAPAVVDMTEARLTIDERTGFYPTGPWATETREYHLCVDLPEQPYGAEMLASRVSVVVGDEVVAKSLVRAQWSEDEILTTRLDAAVAHYTGQSELASAIQDGLEARRSGDAATATVLLGRAAQLATAARNAETLRLLDTVIDVVDAATGTVRLRRDVDDADRMALETRSTRTVRVSPPEPELRTVSAAG